MTYSAEAIEIGLAISKIFINHKSFKEAIEAIGKVLSIGNGTQTFAGVRIIAPSGTGKSLLLKCIQNNVMNWPLLNVQMPIIHTSLKESPNVAQVQTGLLKNFNYGLAAPFKHANNNDVNNILVTSINQFKVRGVALDEFQHVFFSNGTSVALPMIDWVKRLMNLTEVPVILLGTEQLERLVSVDPQLITRIPTSIRLNAFKYDEEWLGFIKAFAQNSQRINLDCICKEFSKELFICTKGIPRTFKSIVVQASMIAADDKKTSLGKEHLRLAYCRHFGPEYGEENPF